MALDDLKPEKVLMKLQGRLSEVFRLYPASFSENIVELLKPKIQQLERKSRETKRRLLTRWTHDQDRILSFI